MEDEFHLVFQCDAYDAVRARFASLFAAFEATTVSPDGRALARFMLQSPRTVAAFVCCCFLVRSNSDANDFTDDFDTSSSFSSSSLSDVSFHNGSPTHEPPVGS